MTCGAICLVQFPFTDGTSAKLRPVLVISRDEYNSGDDLVVVPISSVPNSDDQFCVFIEQSSVDFPHTGLKRSSAIKWTKPFTLSKQVLHKKLGILAPHILKEVQSKVASIFYVLA